MAAATPMTVPLRAAFTGLRALPWLALSSSDFRARLVLHENEVETRVVWSARRRPYAAISEVDLRTAPGTVNVVLAFEDSWFTFIGNTGDRAVAARVLRHLAAKGCFLSARAGIALAEATPR